MQRLLFCLAILCLFSYLFEEDFWIFDTVVNFFHWFLVLSMGGLLLTPLARFRGKVFFISNACILGLCLWVTHPFFFSYFSDYKEKGSIEKKGSLIFLNLYSQNSKKNLVINHLKAVQPDLVFLVEFDLSWAESVSQIKDIYPYAKAIPRDGNFGMAVLSKTPINAKRVFASREDLIPAMQLEIKSFGENWQFFLLHPFPPIGSLGTLARDRYLETMAGHISDSQGPTIVCGDFNTVPWAKVFRKFLSRSGIGSSEPKALYNTWPTFLGRFGLPLDNCLFKNLQILKKTKGPYVGSDHWPLFFEFGWLT